MHYKRYMNYPFTFETFNQQNWEQKTNAMHMLSFQVEHDNLPIIIQFAEVAERLATLPLSETLGDQPMVKYFFDYWIPVVCDKLIRSKYFKNGDVLVQSNNILIRSMEIFEKYFYYVDKYPKFAELVATIFNHDNNMYFEHNNQVVYEPYPWIYYKNFPGIDESFVNSIKDGDEVDAIKYDLDLGVACWSKAEVLKVEQDLIHVSFNNCLIEKVIEKPKQAFQFAPVGTKSVDEEWRLQLKEGDLVMCMDKRGIWYQCIVKACQQIDNCKIITIGYQLQSVGEDQDDYPEFINQQTLDYRVNVMSPQIQPHKNVSRFNESPRWGNKSVFYRNDHIHYNLGHRKILVTPRHKYKSDVLFNIIRQFAEKGGINKLFDKLIKTMNTNLLMGFCVPLGAISEMFHIQYIQHIYIEMRKVLELFISKEQTCLDLFKEENSKRIFKAINSVFKKAIGQKQADIFQINLRKQLALIYLNCVESRKMDCVEQLVFISTNAHHNLSAALISQLKEWFNKHDFFNKIFIDQSSVDIFKKAKPFFQFMITNNSVSLKQITTIFEFANTQTSRIRVIIYKLLEEYSHLFNQDIIDCLISMILQIQPELITIEQMSLLLCLSKKSINFPILNLIKVFLRLLFDHSVRPTSQQWIIQNCSQQFISSEIISDWKELIDSIVSKLFTGKIFTAANLLIAIMTQVDQGQQQTYKILEYINDVGLDHCALKAITESKDKKEQNNFMIQKLFELLTKAIQNVGIVYFDIDCIKELYRIFFEERDAVVQQLQFNKFCTHLFMCKGMFKDNEEKVEQWFMDLTKPDNIKKIDERKLHLIVQLFQYINVACDNITQHQYLDLVHKLAPEPTKNVSLKAFKYYKNLLNIIYNIEDKCALKAIVTFYKDKYGPIPQHQSQTRLEYMQLFLQDFFEFHQNHEYTKIERVFKLIDLIIDESQEFGPSSIKTLAMYRKGQDVEINVVYDKEKQPDYFSGGIPIKSNQTIFDLKYKIAQKQNCIWKEIRFQIEEGKCLNRTIEQLGLTRQSSQLKYGRIYPPSNFRLLADKKLVPGARTAFIKTFERFQINGTISKYQCKKLIHVCLGEINVKTGDDRIHSLYDEYDLDEDCHLTLDNFLTFFEQASDIRPNTVWSNLKSLGFRYDFEELSCVTSDILQKQALPRYHLSNNVEFVNALFELINEDQISSSVWKMLESLAVRQNIYRQILHLPFNHIIDIKDPNKTLYYLYIISDLFHQQQTQQQNIKCRQKLIKENICGKLFMFLEDIYKDHNQIKKHIKIIDLIFEITIKHLVCSFQTKSNIPCHRTISLNKELDYVIKVAVKKESLLSPLQLSTHKQQPISAETSLNILIQLLRRIIEEQQHSCNQNLRAQSNIISLIVTFSLYQKDCSAFLEIFPFVMDNGFEKIVRHALTGVLFLACSDEITDKQPLINTLINYLENVTEEPEKQNVERQGRQNLNSSSLSYNFLTTLNSLVTTHKIASVSSSTRDNLIKKILQSRDQYTIKSSAVVLINANTDITMENIKQIWVKCLFNQNNQILKQRSVRKYIYKLILSIAQQNPSFLPFINELINSVLQSCLLEFKLMNNQRLDKRSVNYESRVGLQTAENQSFIVSLLHLLYNNKKFKSYILSSVRKDTNAALTFVQDKQKHQIIYELRRLFRYLELTNRRSCDPTDLISLFKNDLIVNDDSIHNFQTKITQFLTKIQDALSPTTSKSLINDLFRTGTVNFSRCSFCKHETIITKNVLNFNLEIVPDENTNLEKAIKKSFRPGKIRCEKCGKNNEQQIAISKFPQYLLFIPNRFKYSEQTNETTIASSAFRFENSLSMDNFSVHAIQEDNKANTQSRLQQIKNKEEKASFRYSLVGVMTFTRHIGFHKFSSQFKQGLKWTNAEGPLMSHFSQFGVKYTWFGQKRTEEEDDFESLFSNKLSGCACLLIYERILLEPSGFKDQFKKKEREERETDREQSEKEEKQEGANENQKQKVVENENISPNTDIDAIISPEMEVELNKQFDEQIKRDNRLLLTQSIICSRDLIEFYSSFLSLQNLSQEDQTQMISNSFKLLTKIWVIQQNRAELIRAIQKLVDKHPHFAKLILDQQSFLTLVHLEKNMEALKAIHSLCFTLIKNLQESREDQHEQIKVNPRIAELLLCKREDLKQKVKSADESLISAQIFFWKVLSKHNPKLYIRFIIENDVLDLLIKQLLLINENPLIQSQTCLDLQKLILKIFKFANKHEKTKIIHLPECLLNVKNLSSVCEKSIYLAFYVLNYYCKDNLELSQVFIRMITQNLKQKQGNKETMVRLLYELLSINDAYQMRRLKLIVGKPQLYINFTKNTLFCLDSKQKRYFKYTSDQTGNNQSVLELLLNMKSEADHYMIMFVLGLFDLSFKYPQIKQLLCQLSPPLLHYDNFYNFLKFIIKEKLKQKTVLKMFQSRLQDRYIMKGKDSTVWRLLFEYFKDIYETENNTPLNEKQNTKEVKQEVKNNGWKFNEYQVCDQFTEGSSDSWNTNKQFELIPFKQVLTNQPAQSQPTNDPANVDSQDQLITKNQIPPISKQQKQEIQSYIRNEFEQELQLNSYFGLSNTFFNSQALNDMEELQIVHFKIEIIIRTNSNLNFNAIQTMFAEEEDKQQNLIRHELTGLIVKNTGQINSYRCHHEFGSRVIHTDQSLYIPNISELKSVQKIELGK